MADALASEGASDHHQAGRGESRANTFYPLHPRAQPGQGAGIWKRYYERWGSMTIEELGAPMIDLAPSS